VYKFNLPTHFRIWLVFNVDKLEPYTLLLPGQLALVQDPIIIDNKLEWEVDILTDTSHNRGTFYYKVHWSGLSYENDTWEPAYHLCHAREAASEFH